MARAVAPARHVGSPRSPLPLLAGGIGMALLVILVFALPLRPPATDYSRLETLNEREAVALVAREMRNGAAAVQVSREGQARFEDGSWFVTVGAATFRFSERNRIVLAENDAGRALQYLGDTR